MELLVKPFAALVVCCLSGAVWGQAPPVSNYDKLKELDKWVGTWEVTGEAFDGTPYVAEHIWKWGLNKNYLMGTFIRKVDGKDRVIAKTMIGWDVGDKQIRGWEFWDDSQGDFVVGDGGRIAGGGAFLMERGIRLRGSWCFRTTIPRPIPPKSRKGTVSRAPGRFR